MANQPKDKKFLLEESKTFCMMPWVHLHVQPDGRVKPCCMPRTNEGTIGDLKENTLEEIWNTPALKKLRLNMLADKQSKTCETCYVLEDSGSNSLRQTSRRRYDHHFDSIVKSTQEDGTVEKMDMKYMDIRFSNVCNFRCRMCGHQLSSRWYGDTMKLWPSHDKPAIIRPAPTEEGLWEQIEPLIPGLEEIYFAGGESLIMEEHYRILKLLEEKKLFHVRLSYNTNFSEMKYKNLDVMKLWNKFDNVLIGASLDASYKQGEYIRKGQKWSQVVENRRRLWRVSPNVDFYISPTVGLMNVWNLPDFHKEWVDLGFIEPNEFHINLLLDPMYYRVQVLPRHIKDQIHIKYNEYLEQAIQRWGKTETERLVDSCKYLLTFMEQEDLTSELPAFRKWTNDLDRIRGEKFVDIFPELAELMDE